MTASTDPRPVASSGEPSARWSGRIAVVVWTLLAAAAFVRYDRLGRGLTFFYDEWDWALNRHAGVRSLLLAHNGHFSLLPAVVFRVLFHTVGLGNYTPYRRVGLLVHVLVASSLALIVARRRGRVAGIALGAVVLFLGTGWENILWPFQIGMMGSLLFGLVAWLLLDHRTRRSDVAATVALCLSVASSGPAIALPAGVVVRLAWSPADRRRVWVAIPPTVLYGAWWLGFGESQGHLGNLRWTGSYVRDLAGSAIAALAGRNLDWGRTAIGFAAAIVLVTLTRRRSVSPGTAGILTALGLNWLLTTYARADLQQPYGSRYAYLGAVLLVVLGVELFPTAPPGTTRQRGPARRWTITLVVLALVAVRANRHPLEIGSASLHERDDIVAAELRALEWAHDPPAKYRPDEVNAPPIFAGSYLATAHEFGSPAYTADAVRRAGPDARAAADRVSLELAAPYLVAVPPSAACRPATVETLLTLADRPGLVIVASGAPVELRLRRLADLFGETVTTTVEAGQPMRLSRPLDDGPATWYADLRSAAPFTLCE